MGAISTIMEKLSEKATNFVCDKFKEILTNKELKDKFKEASQKYFDEIFENCDLSGEFDFKEVESYLIDNFDNKIIAIFHEVKNIGSKGRDSIRENILSGAVKRGNGNEEAIRKYCNAIIDFVGACLYSKTSDSDKQLASEITAVTNEYYKHLVNEMGDLRDIELKILNEIRYFGSFAEQIDNIGLPKLITKNKFSFANPSIGFYGRYDEQKEIDKFMSDNRPLLFWFITGRGGVGKSKFALYLCQKYERANWKAVWLNKDKIENINRTSRNDGYNKPLLFICDYASEYIESIKTFLLNISSRTQNKIRILLLERSVCNQTSNSDYFTYSDVWYDRLLSGHDSDEVKEMEYRTDSLNLDNYVLSDDAMFSILDDFSEKKLSMKSKKDIVDFVKNMLNSVIDKNNYSHSQERCLFLLFTADAFLNEKDYSDWDTKALIDQYIKRFRRTLEAQYDKNICEIAYIILAIATAIGTINLEIVDYDYAFAYYVDLIKEKLNYNIDINNIKMFLNMLCEKTTPDLNVYPMFPDIVGEFFFINIFYNMSTEYKRKFYKIFCSEKYKKYFCSFFKRCLTDWYSLKIFQNIIKELLEFVVDNNCDSILEECVDNSFFIGLSYYYKLSENDLLRLEGILLINKNEKYYVEYSGIIVNAVVKMHDFNSGLAILDRIKDEILSVCNSVAIAEQYAMALVNVASLTSNVDDRLFIADRIKDDILSVYNTDKIATFYATGLFNVTPIMLNAKEIQVISDRIHDEILNVYNTVEIAERYAKALYNETVRMSNANEIIDIAKEIKHEILSIYNTADIAALYVSVLLNLSNRLTNGNDILAIAKIIKNGVLNEFNMYEIAELYAMILVNASFRMPDVNSRLTIATKINDEILSVYNTSGIALKYATALLNVSFKMHNSNDMLSIAKKIKKEILNIYNNVKIAEQYAMVLVNASFKTAYADDSIGIAEKINNDILILYNTAEIAKLYAMALVNASLKMFNVNDKLLVAKRIKGILEKYNTKEIANIYIKELKYISQKHAEQKNLFKEIETVRREYDIAFDEE